MLIIKLLLIGALSVSLLAAAFAIGAWLSMRL